MIIPELPIIDDAGPPRRKASTGRRLALSMVLSIGTHLSAYGGYYLLVGMVAWLGFTPPHLVTRSRRASIALQASIAAAPESSEDETPERPIRIEPQKPRVKPPPKIAEVSQPTAREEPPKSTEAVEPAMNEPKVSEPEIERAEMPDEPRPDDQRRQRSKTPAKTVAPVESVESASAMEVEGSQFDEPPYAHLYNQKPPYPQDARAQRLEGVVLLRLKISAEGAVEEAVVVESSGIASFDDSAQRTALRWRFTPARLLGRNVMVVMEHVVRFTFRDAT
ncbi:MAG: hypothetical protein C0483_00305 [Pirellula sp.]|nr:hypothetical protein [Pirellula sp.]